MTREISSPCFVHTVIHRFSRVSRVTPSNESITKQIIFFTCARLTNSCQYFASLARQNLSLCPFFYAPYATRLVPSWLVPGIGKGVCK